MNDKDKNKIAMNLAERLVDGHITPVQFEYIMQTEDIDPDVVSEFVFLIQRARKKAFIIFFGAMVVLVVSLFIFLS